MRVTDFISSTTGPAPSARSASSLAELELPCTCTDLLCLYPSALSQCGTAAAVHFASQYIRQHGGPALILCPPHVFEDCHVLPLPPAAAAAEHEELFSQIQLKYMTSATALMRFAAAMHLLPQPPAVIVVMSLSRLLTAATGRQPQPQARGQEVQLVHLMGLLSEGVRVLRSLSGKTIPLLVTDEASDTAQSPRLFILERWLPTCFKIQATGSGKMTVHGGGGSCAFTLSLHERQSTLLCPTLKSVVLHYTMYTTHIQLNGVTFDNEHGHARQDFAY